MELELEDIEETETEDVDDAPPPPPTDPVTEDEPYFATQAEYEATKERP